MPCTLAESLALSSVSFGDLPRGITARVFGVDYAHVVTDAGDQLFLTSYGWPWLGALLPERWYHNGYFRHSGTRLRFSTGTVYRVPLVAPRKLEIVVKFSRIGQHLESERLTRAHQSDFDPSFVSPFEEIAMLERLRNCTTRPRIYTKRALAILSPAEQFEDWELGREQHRFQRHARRLLEDQALVEGSRRVTLERCRDYLIVFQWMRGLNLEECVERGIVDLAESDSINRMVQNDLKTAGFDVLDHKPNHIILSVRRDGSLLKRRGRVVYGLADFELLVPQTSPGVASERRVGSDAFALSYGGVQDAWRTAPASLDARAVR
jgi:hypothetical protein